MANLDPPANESIDEESTIAYQPTPEEWLDVFQAVKDKPCHVAETITIKGLRRTRLETILPFLHDMRRATTLEEVQVHANQLHAKLTDLGIFNAIGINLRPGVRHHLSLTSTPALPASSTACTTYLLHTLDSSLVPPYTPLLHTSSLRHPPRRLPTSAACTSAPTRKAPLTAPPSARTPRQAATTQAYTPPSSRATRPDTPSTCRSRQSMASSPAANFKRR